MMLQNNKTLHIQVSSKAAKAAVTDVIFADTTVRPRKKSTLSLI